MVPCLTTNPIKMAKSILAALGFQESEGKAYDNRVIAITSSKMMFSTAACKLITKCVIRECSSKFSAKKQLKLYVEAEEKAGKKVKHFSLWCKLDGISAKRYQSCVNKGINPAMVIMYMEHDTKEEWGTEENNYSWRVCRIKENALMESMQDKSASPTDAELFGE
jgi:hypothetical protein